MKQYKPINLVAVLLVSFVAWVYCVAPDVYKRQVLSH